MKLYTVLINLITGEFLPTLLSEGGRTRSSKWLPPFWVPYCWRFSASDMGYFEVFTFAGIEQLNTFWISMPSALLDNGTFGPFASYLDPILHLASSMPALGLSRDQ